MLYIEGGAKRVKLMFAGCGPLAQAKKSICKLLPIIRENGAEANWTGTLEVAQKRRALAAVFALKMRMKTHRVARSMATKR